MNIELIHGPQAQALLASPQFQGEWSTLWAQCPWATAFQSYPFANAWYSTYRDRFEPWLALGRTSDGALSGLLTLATSRDGELMVAGGFQAEYHAWISTGQFGDEFPARVIELLHRQMRPGPLVFKYLAPGAPIQWLQGPGMKKLCSVKTSSRPIMRFGDGQAIGKSLKSSNTKKKLRALGQIGEIRFTQVTCPEQFATLFDQIVDLWDFRHGALQGSAPFCQFPLQKLFHLAMMNAPGLLHVTTLNAGDRMVAAHFGACSRREIHMGTIVHDPALARHSPGRLMLLHLPQMLMEQGYEQIDLTPGGDAYKEQYANDADQCHVLTVLPNTSAKIKVAVSQCVRETTRRTCLALGITPERVRRRLGRLPRPARIPALLIGKSAAWLSDRGETGIYFHQGPAPHISPDSTLIRRDSYKDLLAYQPWPLGPTRQQFLSTAIQRVESGQHVYTAVHAGQLQHVAWMLEHPTAEELAAWLPNCPLPPHAAFVHGFGPVFPAPDWDLAVSLLQMVIRDAMDLADPKGVLIVVPGPGDPARRVVEELGFTPVGSICHTVRLGRRRLWINGMQSTPQLQTL